MSVSIRITDMDSNTYHDVHSRDECRDSMEKSMYDEIANTDEVSVTCGRTTFDWLPDGKRFWFTCT